MKHETIKNLLERYNINPNKVLGQNFLTDKNIIDALLNAAEISAQDIVIEVGPGTGTITKKLAKRAKEVLAVEKDPKMVEILQDELKECDNVKIIEEDILNFQIENLALFQNSKFKIQNSHYKVVGAPPYYLTGRLFRKFLEEAEVKPELITVIIQKEVAEKICAKPPDMNLPAVSVQLYGKPKMLQKVPAGSFWPRPEVNSAILSVKNIKKPPINEKEFFKIVRAGFSSPRKQLAGNLSRELNTNKDEIEKILKNTDINPKRRAQTLRVEEWITLLGKVL